MFLFVFIIKLFYNKIMKTKFKQNYIYFIIFILTISFLLVNYQDIEFINLYLTMITILSGIFVGNLIYKENIEVYNNKTKIFKIS